MQTTEVSTKIVKTRKTAIGKVTNPALDDITGITDVTAADRLPRARVWRYYPQGSAELDTALALSTSTVGTATFVCTPLPLSQFPLNGDTGFPDVTQIIWDPTTYPNAALPSVVTGDPELSTPGFEAGQRVQFGTPVGPQGTTYELTDKDGNGIFGLEVQAGCVITLADVSLSGISGSQIFVNESEVLETVISNPEGRGDTLFVGEPVPNLDDLPGDDAPDSDQMEALILALPDYRVQFDLKVGKRSGDFIDASLPTKDDRFPLPLQKWLGQRPPQPLTCIEGSVEFVNSDRKPLKLPCLKGEAADDSGDVQIPYLVGSDTELTVLGEVAPQFKALLGSDSSVGLPYGTQIWSAIYPDEIVMADGELNEFYVLGSPDKDPATLYSARDVTPVAATGGGTYVPDSAIGDARPYDLLLVEAGQPLQASGDLLTGMTGVLTIGAVESDGTTSKIEVPRFATATHIGGLHRYTAHRIMGHLTASPGTSGVFVTSTNPANWLFDLDCSTIGSMIFSSHSTVLTGGLLDLISGGNAFMVKFYSQNPAQPVNTSLRGTLVIPTLLAAGTIYVQPAGGAAVAVTLAGSGVTLTAYNQIRIETTTNILAALTTASDSTFYDFTLTVDTYIDSTTDNATGNALGTGSGLGSTTCRVQEDRLTFSELLSFRTALPRGSNPANGDNINLEARLEIQECPVGTSTGCTVNSVVELNGSDYFSFLERLDGGVPYVGKFSPNVTASLAEGTIKVMSWEGHNNTPLPYTTTPVSGILLSAVPSSDLGGSAPILEGTGTVYDDTDGAATIEGWRHWIEPLTTTAGDLENVVAGDIVVINESSTAGRGAVTAGTYLVRHVVVPDLASTVRSVELTADAGFRSGLDMRFPTVKSIGLLTMVVEGVPSVPDSDTDCGFKTGGGATFVYLIRDKNYCSNDGAAYTLNVASVYRMRYANVSYDPATQEATFTLTLGSAEDAEGVGISDAAFRTAARENGVLVSGMVYFPILPPASLGLPANNCVGADSDGTTDATAGFNLGVAGNRNTSLHPSGGVDTATWDKTVATDFERLLLDGDAPATAEALGVRVVAPSDSTAFDLDKTTAIYARGYTGANPEDSIFGVPRHVSLEGLTSVSWELMHFSSSITIPTQAVNCLLPRDRLIFSDALEGGGNPGFHALGGIYLEPSFPRPTTNLNLANPHVVSESHSLAGFPEQVAHRNVSDFLAGVYSEDVHFYVRRIRRFHDVQTQISDNLELLKYVYELRKGDFQDGVDGNYNTGTRVFTAGAATYGTATNLGEFDDAKVNINSGDTLRILSATGDLIDQAEIQKKTGANTLLLRRPGLTEDLSNAMRFEVYLEQAIVPHEQSNQQLLDLVTESVVHERTVDYAGGQVEGGEVPSFNVMRDTDVTDWTVVGVAEGDYVLVPPSGSLYEPEEVGMRPVGDTATLTRTPYVPGAPASLDDNRGFYKVTTVDGVNLEVDGASRFAGGAEDGADDVVMGDATPDSEYVVLPTVHASNLTGTTEGQQSLRPTAAAVGTSFLDRTSGLTGDPGYKSIQPFPYKIIRPASIFSEDSVELVLFVWERMLSWIEEMQSIYQNGRGGDYYVFQRDDHIEDIGSPTDPSDGRGVVSNLVISGIAGLTNETPYANVSDCLSILGRRFWVLDTRLDEEGYTSFADDAYGQRPVLPDLVEDVLDLDDRFRDMRYSWIRFRADRVSGSIIKARRAVDDIPEELQKQQELLDQKKALDDE